jgi:hypothetical protein
MIKEMISSLLSVLGPAREAYVSHEQHAQESQSDFVLDSIGSLSCLDPGDHSCGSLSLDSIDRRVRLQQECEPERARKCGMPALEDPLRQQHLKQILRDMARDGKVRRSQGQDRWEMVDDKKKTK